MPELDVQLEDKALFVVPRSGALWIYDFGNKTEVLRDADEQNFGPVFQVAQATVGGMRLFLVLPTFAAASATSATGKVRGLGSPPAKEMISGSSVTLRISRIAELVRPWARLDIWIGFVMGPSLTV